MSEDKFVADPHSVDRTIQEFTRRSKIRRISYVILVACIVVATIAILAFFNYQKVQAEKQELIARAQAQRAENEAINATERLNKIAKDLLGKILGLDQRAEQLCQCKTPAAYLWRNGARPPHAQRAPATDTDGVLALVLRERASLLEAAGPSLAYSSKLSGYVCEHLWFVIGESVHESRAQQRLSELQRGDPRYKGAEIGFPGPRNPEQRPVLVAIFVTHEEAKEVAREIGVRESDLHQAGYAEQYQPDCRAVDKSN